MAIATFDFTNLRIILPSGDVTIEVERDMYSAWKRAANLSSANMGAPPAFRPSVGGDSLSPGIEAGAYFFLQNQNGWRIRPAEEDGTITLTGNLAAEDPSLSMTVPTIGAFTVLINGLQPVTQSVEAILTEQQNALYAGRVTIDVANGVPGTAFPVGSEPSPVNNIADARVIADARNFRKYSILNGALLLDQNYNDWEFVGSGFNSSIDTNSQSVANSIFREIIFFGTGSGSIVAFTCQIDTTLSGIAGEFLDCIIRGTVTAPAGGDLLFKDCADGIAGLGTPTFILVPGGGTFQFRSWNGGILLQGLTEAAHSVSFEADPGRLVLDASNTAGSILVRGTGTFTDNSAGTSVDKNGFIDGLDVKLIKALDAGNVTVTGSNPFVVEVLDPDDNLTPIARFDISADGRTRTRTL